MEKIIISYSEKHAGGIAVVLGLEADCLVVVDLDGVEDLVMDQALEDGAVNLAEKFASVDGGLGNHDEPNIKYGIWLKNTTSDPPIKCHTPNTPAAVIGICFEIL